MEASLYLEMRILKHPDMGVGVCVRGGVGGGGSYGNDSEAHPLTWELGVQIKKFGLRVLRKKQQY